MLWIAWNVRPVTCGTISTMSPGSGTALGPTASATPFGRFSTKCRLSAAEPKPPALRI